LSQLQDSVPSAANLSYYLEIVREKFLLRKMIQTCSGVVGRIYDYEGEVDTLLDEVEKEVLRVNESRVQGHVQGVKDLVTHAIGTIENFFNRKGELSGLATGFQDLDKMTDGLHGGEMIVVAARPSMGKTSLAMNIAEHVALEVKLPVAVFSLEMSAEALVLRMMCSIARVNLRSIREGFMSESDFPKLMTAAGRLSASKLFIDATAGLSILQLRARARRMAQQHDIKLFIVDYLQLLHSTARRSQENRQQEIAEISGGLKALAKELNVPVVVLSQLNRELEKDKSRKPRLSDLRESGAIEQDADLVGLLYKPNAGDDDDGAAPEENDGVPVNLLIAKQRNGPTGDVNLTFLKPYTRFESAAKFSEEDLPAGR
jgi:replicative DNA helicase